MFALHGRKALITGATGGIGGAIARALHAQGATVALSGTRRDALDALASDLGERVHMIEANLSDKDSIEALVPAAEAVMGGLDILVNNAGITRDNLFMRMKDEEWEQVLAVNLTAAFRLSRAAVKGMMRRRPAPPPRAAARREGHDAPPARAHRQCRLGGGHHRQPRPGQLRGVQGGPR